MNNSAQANLVFNFEHNPELNDAFANWKEGDSRRIVLDAQLLSKSDGGAELSLNEIEVPDAAMESKSFEPTSDHPVLIVVSPTVTEAGPPKEI